MKLVVYKGFDIEFLKNVAETPLSELSVEEKKNVLGFSASTIKKLRSAFQLNVDEDIECWVTYEEFALIKKLVETNAEDFGIEIVIVVNNIYPGYYPLEFAISDELKAEITDSLEKVVENASEECKRFLNIYNALYTIDGVNYASFYNYEFDNSSLVKVQNAYPTAPLGTEGDTAQIHVHITNDVPMYLNELSKIIRSKPESVGYSSDKGKITDNCLVALAAYCRKNKILLVEERQSYTVPTVSEEELIAVARNDIKIPNFTSFRKLRFYKEPDISNETEEISQSQLIGEIIEQAEKAYGPDHKYRDIFITASTGAGKSVMFQIPAVYLAKKHHKLTIIIEPVKALMQDQKEQLNKRGYFRVDTFNSDLISQAEKEAVLEKVKSGQTDLLYMSPETLLSYSMETLIGEREIGLIIVDEAHIVTTWGVGFRPDYWYLGAYLYRLRNQLQYGKKRKISHFPICAFTATAVSGGDDDTITETVQSLYMENPIKHIGYVKRDNIDFNISVCEQKKLPGTEYEDRKAAELAKRIKTWVIMNDKTIVYFPYATIAGDVKKGVKNFIDKDIPTSQLSIYTGRNLDNISAVAAREEKEAAFEAFKSGKNPVMLATKAFGMGIDIDDIQNVYHYAASGNLSDYVQEIGRAARRKDIRGCASMDFFENDINYMKALYGMSAIRKYHIDAVLSGIYNTYKNKKGARSFLISPESFTYIFSNKTQESGEEEQKSQINKLKTSLLMLEKDLNEKFNFKVLIARPRGVFTKAFVVIPKEKENEVLHSKYGLYLKFVEKGRENDLGARGVRITDTGDVYEIDLKQIWENYYQQLSFPEFKYWYFNHDSSSADKKDIMPEIRENLCVRQKVTVESKHNLMLCELREKILSDFDCLVDSMYESFGKSYFAFDDLVKVISKINPGQSRIIAHSLFQLADPENKCINIRREDDAVSYKFNLGSGIFKDLLRKTITSSDLIRKMDNVSDTTLYRYMYLSANEKNAGHKDAIALKMLSLFDYISYEVVGGTEPEIFIRLNDPEKVRCIINGEIKYSNSYVTKAQHKHDRNVKILRKFFVSDMTSEERWDYIERYFLGEDVTASEEPLKIETIPMVASLVKNDCYEVEAGYDWDDLEYMFETNVQPIIAELAKAHVPVPQMLGTVIKKHAVVGRIEMSWPKKNVLVFSEEISKADMDYCISCGWKAFEMRNIDIDSLKEALK